MSAAAAPAARDFQQDIIAALRSGGALTKEDLYRRLDAFGVTVDRALQSLLNQAVTDGGSS